MIYFQKIYRYFSYAIGKALVILKWYCIFYAVMSALLLNFPKTTGALIEAADRYLSPEAYLEEIEII